MREGGREEGREGKRENGKRREIKDVWRQALAIFNCTCTHPSTCMHYIYMYIVSCCLATMGG